MGHWVLPWASLGEGIMVLCDNSPEDGSCLVSLSRSCGQCCGSFIPELFVPSDWKNNPKLYCFYWSLSGICTISWFSDKHRRLREQTHAHLVWFPLAHVTQTAHQPALREQAFCATVFPEPPPSLSDLSRSWVTRFTGSILGLDKLWLEGKVREPCTVLAELWLCRGQPQSQCIYMALSLWRGGPDVIKRP